MERFARNNTPGPSDGPSLEDERRGCPDSLSASELYLWMDGGDINQKTTHWKRLFIFFFFSWKKEVSLRMGLDHKEQLTGSVY